MSETTSKPAGLYRLPDPACPKCKGTGKNGFIVLNGAGNYKFPKDCTCVVPRLVKPVAARKSNQLPSLRHEPGFDAICSPDDRQALAAMSVEAERLSTLSAYYGHAQVRERLDGELAALRTRSEPIKDYDLEGGNFDLNSRQADAAKKREIITAHEDALMKRAKPVLLRVISAAKPIVQAAIEEITSHEAGIAAERFGLRYQSSETVLALENLLRKIEQHEKYFSETANLPFGNPLELLFNVIDLRTPDELDQERAQVEAEREAEAKAAASAAAAKPPVPAA